MGSLGLSRWKPVLLRACSAVVGAAALAFAVVWAAAIALGAGGASVYDSIRILGFLGVIAWAAGSGCALAYAKSSARAWAAGLAGGTLLGLLLFAAWSDMYDVTGCG